MGVQTLADDLQGFLDERRNGVLRRGERIHIVRNLSKVHEGKKHVQSSSPPPIMSNVILVTGGSGLVGQGIKHVIETEPAESRFGKHSNETWIFATSKEGDLR